jgi:hypothetical protein
LVAGETLKVLLVLVVPSDHVNVPLVQAVAVSVALLPAQIVVVLGVITGLAGFRTIFTVEGSLGSLTQPKLFVQVAV